VSPGWGARSGEFELIDVLMGMVRPAPPQVLVGVGDDGAVLAPTPLSTVVVCDSLVEGTHFRFDWSAPRDVGFKAIASNVSDIAAMGAVPTHALLALTLPAGAQGELARGLCQGVAAGLEHYGVALIGGDTTRSAAGVVLTVTMFGDLAAAALRRNGARPGDALWVSGPTGLSALGLALLERGEEPRDALEALALGRHRRGHARPELGVALAAAGAHAAIDISDGLLQEARHLAWQSGCAVVVDTRELPLEPGFSAASWRLGLRPHTLALTGGEDYELLFALGSGVRPPPNPEFSTRVGWFEDGAPGQVVLLDLSGQRTTPEALGWSHF
jgi:thiamine-monophosphate kinase